MLYEVVRIQYAPRSLPRLLQAVAGVWQVIAILHIMSIGLGCETIGPLEQAHSSPTSYTILTYARDYDILAYVWSVVGVVFAGTSSWLDLLRYLSRLDTLSLQACLQRALC